MRILAPAYLYTSVYRDENGKLDELVLVCHHPDAGYRTVILHVEKLVDPDAPVKNDATTPWGSRKWVYSVANQKGQPHVELCPRLELPEFDFRTEGVWTLPVVRGHIKRRSELLAWVQRLNDCERKGRTWANLIG